MERYQKFEEHLPEWRTLYPKLASVDMRYETQAVLDMQPGAVQPQSAAPAATSAAPAVTHPAVKAAHPATKAPAKHPAVKHAPTKKNRARAAVKAKHSAVKRHSGAANYHSSQAVHR